MPAANTKSKKKKTIKKDVIDPQQEQINSLIRDREEIRSKFDAVCFKLIENVNIDNYATKIDVNHQQPSDLPLENIFKMIEEICHYRKAFLNLVQETEDQEKISVHRKITQLARDEPDLFRKRLTTDQRLSFVIRERDLWKENARSLQIMYGTVVDQLEMGVFKKVNRTSDEILRSHRLNLEDVCRIFSSAKPSSIADTDKRPVETNFDQITKESIVVPNERPETPAQPRKRNVSFASQVDVFQVDREDQQTPTEFVTNKETRPSSSVTHFNRRPSARETSVDEMDSNLRMFIIKELSKDANYPRPSSRRSSLHNRSIQNYSLPLDKTHRSLEWIEFARLIGIRESEIEHWLSQSLQYPAGRVIATWCRSTSPPPTVADLHRLLSTRELHRSDLLQSIETIYKL